MTQLTRIDENAHKTKASFPSSLIPDPDMFFYSDFKVFKFCFLMFISLDKYVNQTYQRE